jgi:hypothetical protein
MIPTKAPRNGEEILSKPNGIPGARNPEPFPAISSPFYSLSIRREPANFLLILFAAAGCRRKGLPFIRHIRFARFCTSLRSPAQEFVDFNTKLTLTQKCNFQQKVSRDVS